jgi:DeoR family transcriptional regulator, aga operon transcriptional repressor
MVTQIEEESNVQVSTGHAPAGAHAAVSLIQTISLGLAGYNKALRRVGSYLLASPEAFMREPLQEIARSAEVSEPTVLRFCRQLGFKGLPDFRIALAMSLARDSLASGNVFVEPGVADKAVVNLAQKRAIARYALSVVGNDRSIIIDSGSTTQLFAEQLRSAAPLAIMTTGLNIVAAFRGASQHTVMLPGGTVRFESDSLSGRMVESTLSGMRFDAIYLGADAIDADLGLSTFNEAEAHQNAAMVGISQRVIVLADSTKFRAPALHRICAPDRIHAVITDIGLPNEIAEVLERHGVRVHRVDPEETS